MIKNFFIKSYVNTCLGLVSSISDCENKFMKKDSIQKVAAADVFTESTFNMLFIHHFRIEHFFWMTGISEFVKLQILAYQNILLAV